MAGIGLKHGSVELFKHKKEQETNAAETIRKLWDILGSAATDIQHIGSTSIVRIKAKPVIDIAVLARDFNQILSLATALEANGFFFMGWEGEEDKQPRFQCGEYDAERVCMRVLTHYVHVVRPGNGQWENYINFRDYMNAFPAVAAEYEALKLRLESDIKNGGDYLSYHPGKSKYVAEMIETANRWREQELFNQV